MNHLHNICHPQLIDPSGERASKSEELGLTMLIDKGISIALFEEHLQLGGQYVDYIKLGFGTTMLYPPELLKKKLLLAKKENVTLYPGGTLFEIACHQDVLKEYFDYMQLIGFDHLEISDGTIELPAKKRQKIIQEAVEKGFTVITECGKKALGSHFEVKELEQTLYSDLECGASYVIVEGRESGENVGIFNEEGHIDKEFLQDIEKTIPSNMRKYLIWEAPQKNQQIELIHFWGRNVNMGNIQFEDAYNLECLRRGLRFDTFLLNRPGQILQPD
ncbi:phosphosulfolactate synthase [Metabacillus arenae]|uniref:Phosphosulfolactate synthase n=1 Tax=Metabacillus arenae TaxID=2771434 RepID=A0A926NAU3_9BACI|nr:phosphosulfolactate synthase [Metabacillus arenae]MBD1379979.1 phosphosulfolactate synthase [Metabacillus arenae]